MVFQASNPSTEPSPSGVKNVPHPSVAQSPLERDPAVLATAVRQKLKSLTAATGELSLPCVPAMLDEHLNLIVGVLRALGQQLSPTDIDSLRQGLAAKLAEGFRASPHARLSLKFTPPSPTEGLTSGLKLSTHLQVASMQDKYDGWVKNRSGPLFGSHADAKLLEVAKSLSDPERSPILDVGAGTGRNSFPLARQSFPVDAVELTPVFAEQMLAIALAENLPVRIFQGNILDPQLNLHPGYYQLAFLSEVISHFRNLDRVRLLLAKLCAALQRNGLLLFNVFLAVDGYEPDESVRQMAEVVWSYLLTRSELQLAMQGLPLEILSDESVYEYEKTHLPPSSWPPTGWFVNWATGRNIFPFEQTPPVELRWILCRRH